MPDELDFTRKYNTPLSMNREQQFQKWMTAQSKSVGRNISNDLYDYDLRGWWNKNNGAGLLGGHLTDEFKKPNHPTFSTGSKYNGVEGNEGGEWLKQSGGSWSFRPGKTNLQNFSADELHDYFGKVEPGNKLLMPQ